MARNEHEGHKEKLKDEVFARFCSKFYFLRSD